MEAATELLDYQSKSGVRQRQYSVASLGTITRSIGKPIAKPYYTPLDSAMIVISLLCLLTSILAVAHIPLATYLGQKNQLILLGLLLSLMAGCMQKQAQLLLITLEARFGASTLQNYDSILRYSMLDDNVNPLLKAAIVFVFALPLALAASYKQFVSGTSALEMIPTVLNFGPVSPPGFLGGPMAMMLNGSLPLLGTEVSSYQSEPYMELPANGSDISGSFGFNVQLVSERQTAVLDGPLVSDLTRLQGTIKKDESLEISANVTATIAILNSTAASPERAQPGYWSILKQSLWLPGNASYGDPLKFAVATGKYDYSFAFMSLWNTTKNETFESEAVGINLYRGYCNATWQITSDGGVTLKKASHCTSEPQFTRPCMRNRKARDFRDGLDDESMFQTPLTCNDKGVTELFVWPLFDLLWLQPVFPVWIAAAACTAWAELAYTDGPGSWDQKENQNETAWNATSFPMLKYEAPVTMIKIVQTLHRDRAWLYLVLVIQPLLLLAGFLGRMLLFSTPISSGFGMTALLAGVSKNSINVLRGAAFSGSLNRPVRVRISCIDQGVEGEARIEYELDAGWRHDRVKKGRVYG